MQTRKSSINSKVRALADTAKEYIEGLESSNPFLAGVLDDIAVDRKNSHRPGYYGVIEIAKLLGLTSLDSVLDSPESINNHPEAFWALLDEAKRQDCLSGISRAVPAVLKLYINFDKRGYLNDAFYSHPLSPVNELRTRPFRDFLLKDFVNSKDTYRLTYALNRHPRYLTLRFKNKALCDMVVNAFLQSLNKYDRLSCSLRVLDVFESWFGIEGSRVNDYRDLDEKLLMAAIKYIMNNYEGSTRKDHMRFLFHFFSTQILQHPDYNFFRNSHIWNSSIVLDRRVPLHIADGYKFAIFGQTSDIDQTGGVLMVVREGDFYSANGRQNMVFTFDLSPITEPIYWKAISRYIIRNAYKDLTYLRPFLIWLQEWKKTRGTDPRTITSVDTNEYRTQMTHVYANGSSRNSRQNHISLFLRWANDEGLIYVMPGALSAFTRFQTSYVAEPCPLSKQTLKTLCNTLKEMGRETPRYLLVEAVVRLMVFTDVRLGELCATRADKLVYRKDGVMISYSRKKNGGFDKLESIFLPQCAEIIKEVVEMTEDVRKQCPVGSLEKLLFIYKDPACSMMPFGVLTNNKVGQDIRVACEKAGLDKITTGNLRDTYMTAATAFAREHKLTDLQQALLTKHANKYSTRSYSIIHLDEILMAAKNITI